MIVDSVRRFLAASGIGPCHVVVASSGGGDSTALLLAFAELRDLGFEVTCAHVNHHLRGDESEGDEAFVRELAETLNLRFESADGSLPPEAVKRSGIEAAARDVRQEQLQSIRQRVGARYIATAHQMSDQAETIIMRLTSGTGIRGLRAIHPVRGDGFIRPLLDVTRDEIGRFLAERGITPRYDSSNDDLRFVRNRVRRALRDLGPEAIRGISQVAREATVLWSSLDRTVDAAETVSVISATESETRFRSLPDDPWVARALLLRHVRRLGNARDLSSENLARIVEWSANRRRITVTRELELLRMHDAIVLRRRDLEPPPPFEVPIMPGSTAALPGGMRVSLRRIATPPAELGDPEHMRQVFSLPESSEPIFTVRSRRPGDRFRPLGLGGTRKVKDALIDRKIDPDIRDRLPILVCNGEIVWMAALGLAESFRVVDDGTGDLYEVNCERVDPGER
jgi:tRNA(Ile)-lysidine synthase